MGIFLPVTDHSSTRCRQLLREMHYHVLVKHHACDTFSAVCCEQVEVLNLGNVQVSKSGLSRSPVYRHVPGEQPATIDEDVRVPATCWCKVALALALRLAPPHLLERGSDARRIAFFEKPNLEALRIFHVQHSECPLAARLSLFWE
jgi:hypothetical protein